MVGPAGQNNLRAAVVVQPRQHGRAQRSRCHRLGTRARRTRHDRLNVAHRGPTKSCGEMRPRSWRTFDRVRRTRDLLLTAPIQDCPACFASTSDRRRSAIPAVFRFAMTRPGVFSPVSHSIHAARSFSGSGGGIEDMSMRGRVATSDEIQRTRPHTGTSAHPRIRAFAGERKRPIPKDRPLRTTRKG